MIDQLFGWLQVAFKVLGLVIKFFRIMKRRVKRRGMQRRNLRRLRISYKKFLGYESFSIDWTDDNQS